MDFDRDWKFVLVNPEGITDPSGSYVNAHEPSFDDSSWRTLNVPHDWSIERDPSPGPGTTSGTGFFQGGLGWYRKTFTLPPSLAGKKLSIEFDGVYMDSSVYVNGELVGNHPYGYTAFNVDLSSRVYTDGVTPNVIAVKVQNQLPSSRWYSGSGIYRHVHLKVTDPIHVARCEFLWLGIDYIGEPTPYDVYPVKASFFGAVDTAGFPKDMYYLFKSQWTQEPMVHLLPMNWTDHEPGQPVAVWAYANVDTVELLLNGQSLGERKFSHKKTLDGRSYLETDEATGDDKTFTTGPFPGSYTSSNGSAGKLHLSWTDPVRRHRRAHHRHRVIGRADSSLHDDCLRGRDWFRGQLRGDRGTGGSGKARGGNAGGGFASPHR